MRHLISYNDIVLLNSLVDWKENKWLLEKEKVKNGYVYEVNFTYKVNGVSYRYWKGGFKTKKEAQEHETQKRMEFVNEMNRVQDCNKTLKEVYDEFMEMEVLNFNITRFIGRRKLYIIGMEKMQQWI